MTSSSSGGGSSFQLGVRGSSGSSSGVGGGAGGNVTVTTTLPGRPGTSERQIRLSAWYLFRLVLATSVGCRRGVRNAAAKSTPTSGSGIVNGNSNGNGPVGGGVGNQGNKTVAEADIQPGSAADVTTKCQEAMDELVRERHKCVLDDNCAKYSRCLKVSCCLLAIVLLPWCGVFTAVIVTQCRRWVWIL